MSIRRIAAILTKDLALGPRGPIFLYALVLPAALTLIFQVAFGSLFAPRPRLGLVDEGRSSVVARIRELDGIDLSIIEDRTTLRRMVEQNDLDAGLVLPAGFDEAVRRGERPFLPFFIGGESYAKNRIVLTIATIDALRGLAGQRPPVEVDVVTFGDQELPVATRLIPAIMFYALVMAGVFIPSSSLVEEKERGTLMALLVTPVSMREVLAAKFCLGALLATVLSLMTLALNRALGPSPPAVLAVVSVAAVLTALIGVLAGMVSRSSTALFGLLKGTGWFLFAPAIFYVFPDWPQWIAKLFPLYWIIDPIWQVCVLGNPLSEVGFELAVACAISALLAAVALAVAERPGSRLTAA